MKRLFVLVGVLSLMSFSAIAQSTIFITELADPNNNSGARFVELFNNGDTDVVLGDGWALQRWTNGNADPQSAVPLTGEIPSKGFYLVSNNSAEFATVYGFGPDQDVGTGGVGDSNGDDNIALLDPSGAVVDMFGVPGEDGSGTDHEFEDGRAQRVETVTQGNPTWTVAEWEIDNDGGAGDGALDAPAGYDPNIWFTFTDPVTPPAITAAYSTSDSTILLKYDQDLTSVSVGDYSLTGTAGVSFEAATLDAADASMVTLETTAPIIGDATLDVVADAANGTDFDLYAGITAIAFTNTLNATGTISEGVSATFRGLVTANDGFNNVWINDGNGSYMGILVFDYDFDAAVAVGDEIVITAVLDIYNNLSQLKNPELLETISSGNPTVPAMIPGSDIASTLAADTNPAEQWEGQLVKIDSAEVLSFDAANYLYELTADGGTTKFLLGDNVDYHFGSISLNVGFFYDVVGVVDYDGAYRINPRDMADVVEQPTVFPSHTVDFEAGGVGADWAWTMDQNGDNPPLEIIANPVSGGANTSATVAKFIARQTGQQWALCITDDNGEFIFNAPNATVKMMVHKPVISDVAVKFEGMSGAIEVKVPNTVTDAWEELTFDFSGVIGNTYNRIVVIPDFAARTQDNTLYLDNLVVPEGVVVAPPAEPTVGAPVPTISAADVLSIYSDSYSNVAGTNFNPNWGQSTDVTVDLDIAGNNTLKYANLNYQGTEFAAQDVSGYDYLHVDFWTANSTDLDFFLISSGPVETAFELPLALEEWVSVDIPLTAFDPVDLAGIFQFKVAGNGTVYFDNLFFHKVPEPEPGLFFSEYTEGSSGSNKYVEIYNPTDADIDLSSYSVQGTNNGTAWGDGGDRDTTLSGILAPGEVFIIAPDAANADILALADLVLEYESPVHHNGDDGIALLKDGMIIDAIGVDNVDPGDGWEVAGVVDATKDHTLIRKDEVMFGNIGNWAMSAGTDSASSQWIVADPATGDYTPPTLGWHINPPPPPPAMLVKAVAFGDTEIDVVYSSELTSVDVANYTLLGTGGVTFTSATLDAADARLVHLVASASIMGDAVLDSLIDAAISDTLEMHAGITPIAFTNALNPGGTIVQGIPATFAGLVTANDGYNNVWVNDGNGAYQGVMIFDYSFDAEVAVGDEIMFSAELDVYNNLSELKNPELLGIASNGNPTFPAIITGADIDSSLAADTNPAEQWEGQLVKIDSAEVLSFDAANYLYELTADGGTTKFLLGDNVDYHFGSISLTVGSFYDVKGVVDYDGAYRINPRGMSDVMMKPVSIDPTELIPSEFSLSQNYPNPFNPTTTITYAIPEMSDVSLVIFNMRGQEVMNLEVTSQSAGYHRIDWNGTDMHGNHVSTGVYFYTLRANDYVATKKMLYLK